MGFDSGGWNPPGLTRNAVTESLVNGVAVRARRSYHSPIDYRQSKTDLAVVNPLTSVIVRGVGSSLGRVGACAKLCQGIKLVACELEKLTKSHYTEDASGGQTDIEEDQTTPMLA